jgi:hypothetical protein
MVAWAEPNGDQHGEAGVENKRIALVEAVLLERHLLRNRVEFALDLQEAVAVSTKTKLESISFGRAFDTVRCLTQSA